MRRHVLPGHPVVWGIALSTVAHAAIVLVAWRAAVPTEAPRAVSLTVRLIERSSSHVRAAAAIEEAAAGLHTASPHRVSVTRTRASASPRAPGAVAHVHANAVVETPAPSAEVVSGAVFGLPRIAFAGGTASTTWMRPAAPPSSPAPIAQLDPLAHAHAQREASRAQLGAALEQRISALPAPEGDDDGSCDLSAQAEVKLDCNNNALYEAVAPQAAALSGLLEAYRGMDTRAGRLSIGFRQGRYQVSLAMDTEQR